MQYYLCTLPTAKPRRVTAAHNLEVLLQVVSFKIGINNVFLAAILHCRM